MKIIRINYYDDPYIIIAKISEQLEEYNLEIVLKDELEKDGFDEFYIKRLNDEEK